MRVEPTSIVVGHVKLTSIFGEWPSFHDAEVLSIRLEREGPDCEGYPELYVAIHVFAVRRNSGSATGMEFYNHNIVTFRFNSVVSLQLTGFNEQNAIFDLVFEKPQDAPVDTPLRITFDPSFGVYCSFFCKSVDIVSVKRQIPSNSAYV